MALQASGPISFSEIATEFGTPPGINLGAYRVSETIGSLPNLPLDAGIPQSGTIRFSDFYNKRLNIVVDLHSPGINNTTRWNARSRYNNNNVRVIGGFRGRPANSGGTKVFVNVNQTIGSVTNNDTRYVALRTGGWNDGTTLQVDVGSNGRIFGAGGGGGLGGTECDRRPNGGGGGNGNSAIGVEYAGTAIINRGYIQCGFGGGGGGGVGSSNPDKNPRDFGAAGGGGGAGAGYPIGGGGSGGRGCIVGIRPVAAGGGGGNSTQTVRGAGGAGGTNPGCSGGAGGRGGQPGVSQTNGGGGSGNTGPIGSGGGAGGNGYRIISSVGTINIGYTFQNVSGQGVSHGSDTVATVL
jgi:hypothetical protein